MSPQVSEFFGVFLLYTEIIEKSRLFGNSPFHWNSERQRIIMDFKFIPYYKFWTRIAITFMTIIIPLLSLLGLHYTKELNDIVPFGVISFYSAAIVVLIGVVVMILPVIILWNVYAMQEIERSFNMFIRLSSVRPSKENGVAITTTVNKIAVLVAQVYSKLPIILTIGFISVNMDPLYYILPITSIMLRSILCLIAMTELCRLVVITLFCVLFVINVVKREMHMFTNITGRSNLGGMLFYRHFAILYNFRRLWATAMLTLITTVGFIMQTIVVFYMANLRDKCFLKKHKMSPQVSEFFGVFLIYTEIIEKSRLFGICPFHWNSKRERMTVDFKFFPYYKFWTRIATTFLTTVIPALSLLGRYYTKELHEIIPHGAISFYCAAIVILIGVKVIILPVIILWNVYVMQEIERSFNMFIRLSSVCPSKKQGGEKTTTINKVAVFIAQLYTKLPIIATLIFVSGDMDPLYYILPITSFSPGVCIFVLRSILFLIAGTEENVGNGDADTCYDGGIHIAGKFSGRFMR
ncbi:hypothetical protein Fcan01_23808 [Folsomia candida]|uniref:Uncharacterized protein n=1 Tax=Folsomia candida TaxID=158441 RepID=A0A226D7X0_FOLCA|nr:hypothetical protein Fcan01_23808 [Folsomia candida]